MKFLWQVRERVRLLPNKLHTDKLPWCREAQLVWVDGTGALRWEDRGWTENGAWHLSSLTLRGTPLLSRKDPGCPTCASLLATGWGPATADCPELEAVRETLNGGFTHLEDAVPALAPLLGLLEPGLYVIADGDAYPADGGGRFFWDVPDEWTEAPATEWVGLSDDDYECEYLDNAPVFLYPTQRLSRFDPDREAYYEERLRKDGPPPRAVALRVQQGLNLLLDGHHKAAAAARLGRAVPCLTILPLEYYEMKPGRLPRTAVRDKAGFGPFTVPVAELPAKWLPERPGQRPRGRPEWPVGRLADREWPAEYRAAGARYPTAKEYALVTAAEIGCPTDEDLRRWLAEPGRYRRELRAALVLLRGGGAPRLKETALRCAVLPDRWCSLKEEAFRTLAAMGGDADAERFFIDYFVELDPYSGHPALTDIANSFWN